MNRMISAIGVLLFCAQVVLASDIPPGMKATPALERFVQYGKDLYAKNHGEPQREVTEKIQNRHNPTQTDEWHTSYYDSMVVTFYRGSSTPGGDLLSKLVLADRKVIMPFDICIGDRKKKVLQKLGSPTETKEEGLYYLIPYTSYSESVTFKFSKEILMEVQWDFEID